MAAVRSRDAGPASGPPEQTRARYPDETGFVARPDGIRIFWERYGTGEPAIVFVPTWSIVHSRIWKSQIPHFARRHQVITFDAPGNGRSDRPRDEAAYDEHLMADDIFAVLDAAGIDRAVLVALSQGAQRSLIAAATRPERVLGLVVIGPAVSLGEALASRALPFEQELPTDEGWAKNNIHYWRRDFAGFLEFFFDQAFTEPHSTKQIEDAVGWGMETDPETLAATVRTAFLGPDETLRLAAAVRCPTLVIQGDEDAITGPSRGIALADAIPGARLEMIAGGGHVNEARDPVRVNSLIEDLITRVAAGGGRRSWTRPLARRGRRVLYISSPIGLGHAQRDAAIAAELRTVHPDVEIDWLAQHPVTTVLEARGERLHPLSAELANESAHIASESSEHDLNAFQAIRRMDEILVNNFMVFRDAVRDGEYDLVVGDEAWDIDYFLHENPELKRTAFAWLTDFVGWLPMPDGGEREAFLTADYNAEMIAHVERFPRIRDRAIFVGEPADIVPDTFGPGLPAIRGWTERHYAFSGYVTGFDPTPLAERREELRLELGFRPDERVVVVTVGGSGVGEALLRRVMAAFPEAARRVNGLRMIAVAGPRIDPDSLGAPAGVDVVGYVPDLYRHLAACDLAVVQGGLTTTMELAAARRPFLYFPLRNHFEQNRHVRHRLDRYGAGRCMDYETADPGGIAAAIAEEIDRPVTSRPVEADGAARAAALIAELL
ncbi:MAG TPA: alpha/beta fold hydrolase [Methylomirabilota bacterium]|nr:alpha/beta fold hydrolase [Methylomirabilota bacterium]